MRGPILHNIKKKAEECLNNDVVFVIIYVYASSVTRLFRQAALISSTNTFLITQLNI